jgi:amiloride-sensitive sodium channel
LSKDLNLFTNENSSKIKYNFEEKDFWTLDRGYKNESINKIVPLRLIKSSVHNLRIFSTLDDINNKCGLNNINVKLHLPNEIPTPYHHEYEFEHGHFRQIILSAKITRAHNSLKSYSPNQRGCYFSDEKKLHFFKAYTRNHCYLECFANYVLENCGCVAFYMPRNSSTKICGLENGPCLHKCNFKWPLNDEMADGKTPCECYPTCNDIEYNVQEIDTDYDSINNADVIKNYSTK